MSKFLFIVIMLLMSATTEAKSIVVLGDSISASYGIDVEQGWVSLLQKKVRGVHGDYTIYNESISGDTSAGGLARIDRALATYKPEIVLIELGANDGLRGLSPAMTKSNLTAITQRSQKVGAKVLLLAMKIPPNYGKRFVDMSYAVYLELSEELKIPFVPFILEEVALKKDMMQADGLHPNAQAQPIIADKIAAYLLPLLNH
jgi:acyl-CoA thioesterase-1